MGPLTALQLATLLFGAYLALAAYGPTASPRMPLETTKSKTDLYLARRPSPYGRGGPARRKRAQKGGGPIPTPASAQSSAA